MQGWQNLAGFKRLYILGAGFSAPAGMPLTNELLPLVFKKAASIKPNGDNSEWGHASLLLDWLRFYCPGLSFEPTEIMAGNIPQGFDFEKFLTYMGVVSATQMGTSEQLDEHGSQEISYFMDWTARVIHEHESEVHRKGLPPVYDKFARAIRESMIFTFNWDTILERALTNVDVPFTLDRAAYCEPPKIPLYKLHGSIDWFTADSCMRRDWMDLRPIGKSLPSLARAHDQFDVLNQYYEAAMTPWIVLPSFDKISQVMRYDDLWQMLYLLLQNELQVYILGFSLRPDDYHTHAIIYPQLVEGARQGSIKVRVVDLASSREGEDEIRARFADIDRCEFYFGGFTEDCLEFVTT